MKLLILITASILATVFLLLASSVIAHADKPDKTPPSCTNKPVTQTPVQVVQNPVQVIQQPVSVTLAQCTEYQIRVITTRGNNSIDSETLGYCDLEQAQNVLAQLNAAAYRKLPKGQPIQQLAYPLF